MVDMVNGLRNIAQPANNDLGGDKIYFVGLLNLYWTVIRVKSSRTGLETNHFGD